MTKRAGSDMRSATYSALVLVVSTVGCAQAPAAPDTALPGACGNAKAVACFAREAQDRLERCYLAMAADAPDEQTVVDACARFVDQDIEDLYNRARDEARSLRGVTADLKRYYEHWRETWSVLEWRFLYGGSSRQIQGEVTALRGFARELIR
jgi:hypothetical protein